MRRGILSRCRWPSPAKLSLVALVSFLGLCLRLGALGAPPQEEPHYPVPIHRLAVTQERLAEELKAHKQGVLVELSRKSFEEKVRAAAEAQQNARTPPRLLESHYRAFFEPAGLHGTAQWKVVHTVPSPGILPLASFNLAIVQARIDNADALLGDLDGNAPGLFVEKKGEHLVTMDWTSRVEARPEGFQIEMDIPPAPIGDLELYVPRDREIAEVTDGCIVTGPHPSDHADHFLWRIQFSHRGQLHFLVRRSHDPEAPQPLVRAQVRSVCEIQPDFLEAEFNFDFKVLHRGVRQLRVLLDAGLDVTSVSLAGMEGYAVALVKPPVGPPAPNGPKMLTIQLREEARAGTLRIHCPGPLVFPTTRRIET